MKSDRFTIKINGIVLFIVAAIIVVATVFITFKFADKVFYSKATVSDSRSVVFDGDDTSKEKIAKFNDILRYVKENYYYAYDENAIIEGAIDGAMNALNDKYSQYYKPGTMSDYNDYVDGIDQTGENVQTVFTTDYTGKIKYIRITQFGNGTGDEFKEVISTVMTEGSKGIIIDLRDNPGGIETAATTVADIILPEGTIATAKDKDGNTAKTILSEKTEIDLPFVVLVNGKTASASELLAAALQDFEKATLVGTQTYGKAVGQKRHTYDYDDSGIKLTVWKYFTPSGDSIDGIGITPDHIIEATSDKPVAELTYEEDPQLQKALEIIRTAP